MTQCGARLPGRVRQSVPAHAQGGIQDAGRR